MRRIFVDEPIAGQLEIGGGDAHHLQNVLRVRLGQSVVVADSAGRVAQMNIAGFAGGKVRLELAAMLEQDTEPPIEVILAQCLPKADKMDFIVQKATELGAAAIVPVESANCIVKYTADKKAARRIKWQKTAVEAAKQCGRTVVPEVRPVVGLAEFLAGLDTAERVVMCYEGDAASGGLKAALTAAPAARYVVLIGPEGGFTAAEVETCRAYGAAVAGMGPRILRAETAAVTALSVVMYQCGDLG